MKKFVAFVVMSSLLTFAAVALAQAGEPSAAPELSDALTLV